ncbi:hypothetical protein CH381_18905 [Leptospira sp. mixed culture ATI2-C-A1]|nr:hypothetical protein CH381_18905 [Leptospira sp. mixed culture ATI2-C-A1]
MKKVKKALLTLSVVLGIIGVGYLIFLNHWSDPFGKMKLSEATEKCKSLGMRLPTVNELKIAHMIGVIKWWHRDGYTQVYWAKRENERTYNFDVRTDQPNPTISADNDSKTNNNHGHARCVY